MPKSPRRVIACLVVATAVVLPIAALAAGGPTASLSRAQGSRLKLVMHWSAGIDYFTLTLVKHKGQRVTNITSGCYGQGSSISCTTSGQKAFTVKFTVTPRYPSHQKNKLSIGHRTITKTINVVGP